MFVLLTCTWQQMATRGHQEPGVMMKYSRDSRGHPNSYICRPTGSRSFFQKMEVEGASWASPGPFPSGSLAMHKEVCCKEECLVWFTGYYSCVQDCVREPGGCKGSLKEQPNMVSRYLLIECSPCPKDANQHKASSWSFHSDQRGPAPPRGCAKNLTFVQKVLWSKEEVM